MTLLLLLSNANEYSEKEAIINTPGPLLVQAGGARRGNLFGGSEATQVTSLVTLGSDVTCDTALSYTCYTGRGASPQQYPQVIKCSVALYDFFNLYPL